MIAIFKPVKNNYGFDLREFKIDSNCRIHNIVWLNIADHVHLLDEVPVLKPKVACSSKQEFYLQFKDYIIE